MEGDEGRDGAERDSGAVNLRLVQGREGDPAIVSELETLLARARSGELQSFAYVAVGEGGRVRTWYRATHRVTAVGAVSWLHYRMVSEL